MGKRYAKTGLYKLYALTGELAEQWPAIARYGDTLCKVAGRWNQDGMLRVVVGQHEAYLPASRIGERVAWDKRLGPMQVVCLRSLANNGGSCGWETIAADRKAAGGSTSSMAIGPCLMKLGDWPLTLAMQPASVQKACVVKSEYRANPYSYTDVYDGTGRLLPQPQEDEERLKAKYYAWQKREDGKWKAAWEATKANVAKHPQAVRGLGYVTRKRIAHPKLAGRTCYWYSLTELGRAALADT